MAVNVIIPIHNTDIRLFERALSSLGAQTKSGFILTVVDDASTEENSIRYQAAIDKCLFPTVYLKSEDNIGPGAARQLGMDKAWPSIDYFMFLDADDMLMPTAVDILYSEAKVNKSDIVVSNILTEGKHRSENFIIPFGSNTTWTHGKIYRRKFLEDNNIRFPDEKIYNEDSYFNLIAIFLAEQKFYITEPMYLWSYNKNSITRKDGQQGFLKEYGIDYIRYQVKAILFILSRKDANVGGTIGMIYNACQKEYSLNPERTIPVHDALLELFDNQYIKDHLYDKDMMESFLERAKVGEDGACYKQSAYEWLRKYRGE